MSRSFDVPARRQGLRVPRWLAAGLAGAALLWIALRILTPPAWVIQRLDSPDGSRTALLLRTQHTRQHFTVRVRDRGAWYTLMTSPPLTNDFRVDLGERVSWSTNSERLFFRCGGETIWGYDFAASRALRADEL
jgi:hypothetical protein